jgi:ABC-type multidrug transport system ATPase subunit
MKRDNFIKGNLNLDVSDLVVSYGKTVALEIESLRAQGRIIAIIGHNGSGKSTFIKAALGLLVPRQGAIEINWCEDDKLETLIPHQHMAFAPENGAVFEDLNVESYVKLWCRIKQNNGSYYRREGSQIIEKLGLSELFPKLGRELSKGQRRRVQAAVGFLTNPKLFFFDEPFDGLDILQSNEMAKVMRQEAKRMGLIVSSHRMEVVERIADLVVVLKNGNIHTAGPLDDVCAQLVGECFMISHSPEQQKKIAEIVPLLQQEFYHCLINQIGRQLMIAGKDISLETIQGFFYEHSLPPLRMDKVRPSLVDAMRYHLNRLH